MTINEPRQELSYLENLSKKCMNDSDFYQRVAGLCLLVAIGISDEVKRNAKAQLEDFLDPNLRVIHATFNNTTGIYLTDTLSNQNLWVLSVLANYRAFQDNADFVRIVSTN